MREAGKGRNVEGSGKETDKGHDKRQRKKKGKNVRTKKVEQTNKIDKESLRETRKYEGAER